MIFSFFSPKKIFFFEKKINKKKRKMTTTTQGLLFKPSNRPFPENDAFRQSILYASKKITFDRLEQPSTSIPSQDLVNSIKTHFNHLFAIFSESEKRPKGYTDKRLQCYILYRLFKTAPKECLEPVLLELNLPYSRSDIFQKHSSRRSSSSSSSSSSTTMKMKVPKSSTSHNSSSSLLSSPDNQFRSSKSSTQKIKRQRTASSSSSSSCSSKKTKLKTLQELFDFNALCTPYEPSFGIVFQSQSIII